jgi:hypothetical protein
LCAYQAIHPCGELTMTRIWFIIPCKGRLAFLRESLPRVLALRSATCCLVDFDCPEQCGTWAQSTFRDDVERGKLVIERARERPLFNKAAAHNAGAQRAVEAAADQLVFLDADTLVASEFLHVMAPALNPHQFWIAERRPDGMDDPDLFGLLIVPTWAFRAAGGFDEQYRGWGIEDLDMRLQLRLRLPLIVGEIPLTLVSGIAHEDALRTQFYDQKDVKASDLANQELMLQKLNRQNAGTIPVEWTWATERMWCRRPRRTPFAAADMVPASDLHAALRRIAELEARLEALRADAPPGGGVARETPAWGGAVRPADVRHQ